MNTISNDEESFSNQVFQILAKGLISLNLHNV